MKKLVELCVPDAKIIDICVEGDKLIEQGTGAVYNKSVKGVKVPKGKHTPNNILHTSSNQPFLSLWLHEIRH
jgi:hypothetical protein